MNREFELYERIEGLEYCEPARVRTPKKKSPVKAGYLPDGKRECTSSHVWAKLVNGIKALKAKEGLL